MRHFYLGLLLFIADQLTKALVRFNFVPGESRPIIDGVIHLTYVRNTGAAFGLFQGQTWLLVALTVVLGFFAFMYRHEFARATPGVRVAYTLGISGALGNFVDRIWLGWVTDFIDLRVWPVFNVADSAIVVGVGLLIWFTVFRTPEEKPAEANSMENHSVDDSAEKSID